MLINIHTHNNSMDRNVLEIENVFLQDIIDVNEYFSVGLHPWHISDSSLKDVDKLEKYVLNEKLLAIGEVGIDKNIDIPVERQLSVLKKQLAISEKYDLPVILHIVKGFSEIVKLKSESNYQQPWIIHGFVKKLELAQQLIDKGFYLSIGSALLNDKSNASEVFKNVDVSKVFFETDDNDNCSISDVYKKAAELRGVEKDVLVNQIERNFKQVFKRYKKI